MSEKKLISFLLPCYNEEEGIQIFNDTLQKAVKQANLLNNYRIEYLFINDGSIDKTAVLVKEFIKSLDNQNEFGKFINFSKNFGHEVALAAGIDYANGDAVIIMDTDLQDPPEVAIQLIAEWEAGADIVYAKRRSRKDNFLKKLTANWFYKIFEHLTGGSIPRNVGNFRLIDQKAIEVLRKYKEKSRFFRGIVSSIGFIQKSVEFDRPDRIAGTTHYPYRKMIGLAVDGIMGFSNYPLKFIAKLGAFFSFFSFLFALYVLISKFIQLPFIGPNSNLPGWTTTVLIVVFFAGIQLFSIGVIGTYIGRIFTESQNRPLYIVDESRSIL